MFLEFKALDWEGEPIESNSIIQKQICDELFVYLYKDGKWIKIKNETLKINGNLINELFELWNNLAECGEISIGQNFNKKYNNLKNKIE